VALTLVVTSRVHLALTPSPFFLASKQTSATGLPSRVQSSVQPLQSQLTQTLKGLQAVMQSEGSASQKAAQVASVVQNQIGPVLEAFKESAVKLTGSTRPQTTHVNGAGTS
jgi:hypothetical protein